MPQEDSMFRYATQGTYESLLVRFFLWRWKVSTTQALSRRIYHSRSPKKAYYALRKLEEEKLIQSRCDLSGKKHVWTLTKKGFQSIKEHLSALEMDGFQSENIGHDLLTSSFQMGDLFMKCPLQANEPEFEGLPTVQVITEQELRCYHPDVYPDWVPKNKYRRTDGYWHVSSGKGANTIALEVQLTRKKKSDYHEAGHFLSLRRGTDKVLWLVKTPGMIKTMEEQTREGTSPKDSYVHSFVTCAAFLKNGWSATIQGGSDKGKTIWQLLGLVPSLGVPGDLKALLDVRKSPHTAKHENLYSTQDAWPSEWRFKKKRWPETEDY